MNLTLRMVAHTRAQTKESRKWASCLVCGLQLDTAIGKATEGEPKTGGRVANQGPGGCSPRSVPPGASWVTG